MVLKSDKMVDCWGLPRSGPVWTEDKEATYKLLPMGWEWCAWGGRGRFSYKSDGKFEFLKSLLQGQE